MRAGSRSAAVAVTVFAACLVDAGAGILPSTLSVAGLPLNLLAWVMGALVIVVVLLADVRAARQAEAGQ